ncbi:DUF1007 family protein [bacterium]|nr:DUF1007 family protein [bacterium]
MKVYLIILLFFFPLFLFSHPHIFIESSIEIVLNDNGIEGMNHKWVFDEMFSGSMIGDFDDGDEVLSKEEIADLKKNAFEYTSEQEYFTRIKVVGHSTVSEKKKIKLNAENFVATIQDGKLIYSFFTPLKLDFSEKKKIIISIYDSTYYVAFSFKSPDVITLKNGSNFTCKIKQQKNTKEKFYFEQFSPDEFIIEFSRKKL